MNRSKVKIMILVRKKMKTNIDRKIIQKKKSQMDKRTQEKLSEMNISPEKAEMILEAMRNGEIQYIQQQKKKSNRKTRQRKT